jgi:acyl-CoA synthetase (AMP-forming)/AMP-acid ligase II
VLSVCLFNNADFVTLYFAAAKTGVIFNPVNYRLTPSEIAYILNDCGARAVVFEKATAPLVEGARPELRTVQHFPDTDADRKGQAVRVLRGHRVGPAEIRASSNGKVMAYGYAGR